MSKGYLSQKLVSKSHILGSLNYFSNVDNLLSFKMAIFVDYSLKYKNNIFFTIIYVNVTTLENMHETI